MTRYYKKDIADGKLDALAAEAYWRYAIAYLTSLSHSGLLVNQALLIALDLPSQV